MHIDARDVLAGQPILKIRKLFKQARSCGHGTQQLIMDVLQVDESTAAGVLCTLIDHGYVEPWEEHVFGRTWRTTMKGNALAQASAAPPVRRATAARALDAFLQRVRQINGANELPYIVERVILFGSYLGEAETVNDVDVAVQLRRRYDDDARFQRQCSARVRHALDQGRRFNNGTEQVLWPHLEIYHLLKSGSRVIKIHDAELEALLLAQGLTRVVYPPAEETQ